MFCRMTNRERRVLLLTSFRSGLRRITHLLCLLLTSAPRSRPLRAAQSGFPDTAQISRGKNDRLHRTLVGSTAPVLDDRGLCRTSLARPTGSASYPILVHRAAALLHASFRPHLAMTPLRFANPSPSSGWIKDLHLQAVVHARHTRGSARSARGGESTASRHSYRPRHAGAAPSWSYAVLQ